MSYWRSYYHVVWATKGREPLIDTEREALLRRSFQATCTKHGLRCHAMGFMPDHVHLALSIPPKFAISVLMAEIKGSGTHRLNHHPESAGRGTFGWQSEFGVLSLKERSLSTVTEYLFNQAERHADGTLYPGLERIERHEAPVGVDGRPISLGEAS